MRILLANEARSGAGGVETYLAAVTSLLASRHHDVALLHDNTSREAGATTIQTREHWSVQDLGLQAAIDQAFRWRPDVCFSHNMRRLAVDEALAARAPVVKMMHGYFGTCVSGQKAFGATLEPCGRTFGPACLVQYVPRRCGRLRPSAVVTGYKWAAKQRSMFAQYAHVVVASDHLKAEYVRHGVAPDRIEAIPLFTARRPAIPAERTVDVVFLGRMTPLKGCDILMRAIGVASRQLGRRVAAVMAGTGPSLERLKLMARSIEADVSFPGWIDATARDALLARARVIAIPSIWPEPFGLAGLEAAASGVPAVAFDVGGISQWLAHGESGLLVDPAGGAASFAATLALILRDAALRERLGDGARQVAERLSAGAHATALERVLSGVVAQ
jgi:glycosyltransferase involved in cell wall biosynthesis